MTTPPEIKRAEILIRERGEKFTPAYWINHEVSPIFAKFSRSNKQNIVFIIDLASLRSSGQSFARDFQFLSLK